MCAPTWLAGRNPASSKRAPHEVPDADIHLVGGRHRRESRLALDKREKLVALLVVDKKTRCVLEPHSLVPNQQLPQWSAPEAV